MLAGHGKTAPSIVNEPRVNALLVHERYINRDLVPLHENRRASNRVDCIVDKCTGRIAGDIYL
jgi:hypothetical protein